MKKTDEQVKKDVRNAEIERQRKEKLKKQVSQEPIRKDGKD